MEAKHGHLEEARATLKEVPPDNTWGEEVSAELELDYGDPARAESLFRKLTKASSPTRNSWTNLGMALSLQDKYAEAVEAYEQALKIDKDHPIVLLDLADAEYDLGDYLKATELYRRALKKIAEIDSKAGLTPMDEALKAQCLAHLGPEHKSEAIAVAEDALRQSSEDPVIQVQAAMVYSLVGDQASAVLHAEEALKGGVQINWLKSSAFSPLADNREFQALLHQR
jgi:tetratricopeptide (TPR) repeat protein